MTQPFNVRFRTMDAVVKTLFNEGKNDGDVAIMCRDGQFRCHSFVLCHTCPTLKTMYVHSLGENQIKDGIAMINASEYSSNIMKNLISLLYGCEDDQIYYSVLDGTTSVFEETIKEYIIAKDYFGINYGRDRFPFTFRPIIALQFIANLPLLPVFNKWREQLCEIAYDKIEDLDLADEKNSFLFSNPELCKNIMELYSKKIKKTMHQLVGGTW